MVTEIRTSRASNAEGFSILRLVFDSAAVIHSSSVQFINFFLFILALTRFTYSSLPTIFIFILFFLQGFFFFWSLLRQLSYPRNPTLSPLLSEPLSLSQQTCTFAYHYHQSFIITSVQKITCTFYPFSCKNKEKEKTNFALFNYRFLGQLKVTNL